MHHDLLLFETGIKAVGNVFFAMHVDYQSFALLSLAYVEFSNAFFFIVKLIECMRHFMRNFYASWV